MEKNTWRRGVSVALILGMTIGGSLCGIEVGCRKWPEPWIFLCVR